jgi:hypothetical protein
LSGEICYGCERFSFLFSLLLSLFASLCFFSLYQTQSLSGS